MMTERLIVGVSGASGSWYAVHLLKALSAQSVETHLIVSKPAAMTLALETSVSARDLKALATYTHDIQDVAAGPASGSFRSLGMIIAPCSMNTLGEIANGISSNLMTRAADVALKERRRLVLAPRETPLTLAHLRNMTAATEMGAIIAPPMPGLYARPETIDALIEHTVGRWLDLFGIDNDLASRWREPNATRD
ncbi:MAG: UbiX family flavin prenyltransferase [Geminicoccaceae bacterium]